MSSLLSLSLIVGCGEKQVGVERVKTVPVSGVVHVDGEPQHYIAVRVERTDGQLSDAVVGSAAYTQPDGSFVISTYEKGDGVPPGDYKLTFQWGKYNLFNGQYTGDKFEGKYEDIESSEFAINVVSDPIDMGTIELTTD